MTHNRHVPFDDQEGAILDWGTGELLPKTTVGFRAMLERRVVHHWKNGPRESRGA
jgi:hypothetical protein